MDYVNYRRQVLSGIAQRLNKRTEDLVPWQDYDPISVDDAAWQLRQAGVNPNAPIWTGD